MRRRLHSQPSRHLTLLILTGSAGVMTYVRDVAVARRLGISDSLDQYMILVLLVSSLGVTMRSSTSSAAMTVYLKRSQLQPSLAQPSLADAIRIVSRPAMVAGSLVLLLGGLNSSLGSPVPLSASVFAFLATCVTAQTISGGLTGFLGSLNSFIASSTCAALVPLCGLLVVRFDQSVTTESLAFWFAVAYVAETLLLALFTGSKVGVGPETLFGENTAGELAQVRSSLARATSTYAVASLIFSLMPLVDTWIAREISQGGAGTVGLASRIPLAIAGLISSSLGPIAQFTFGVDSHSKGGRESRRQFNMLRRRVIVGSVLIAAPIAILSHDLSRVLLGRGRLLTADAGQIGDIQTLYCLAIPPLLVGNLYSRALQATGSSTVFVTAAISAVFANLCLDLLLGFSLGLRGIPVASALVYCLTSLILHFNLQKTPLKIQTITNDD